MIKKAENLGVLNLAFKSLKQKNQAHKTIKSEKGDTF